MNNSKTLSLSQIKDFLKSSDPINFKSKSREERNDWIQAIIMYHKYLKCSKKHKILLRQYMIKMTGLSKAQITRLISEYKKCGTLKPKKYERKTFEKIYTKADIELLVSVDNAHKRLSGPATKKILQDEFNLFSRSKFERLKNISVAHLYRLRSTPRYRERSLVYSKTNPTNVNIGERRKPEPNGKPGFLCVDTVHQGDKKKEKGIYHINMVDMVTQYEFVGAAEAISSNFMKKILSELLEKFPFRIIEFHSDNGSEYINQVVVKLLNELLIELTKTRPRHSNDNGLAETKNGAVIRKHMGYIHIPQKNAEPVNKFYLEHFNDYLNYHRPCAFPKTIIDKKGKEKKIYPHDWYQTPYERLKSLTESQKYLRNGITFEKLDKIAYAISHTEYAEKMQKEKEKLFKNLIM
jgi:transposase InsO family protein